MPFRNEQFSYPVFTIAAPLNGKFEYVPDYDDAGKPSRVFRKEMSY